MATTGLAATVGVAGARSSSLIHLVRRVGPIGALARQAAAVRTHARARSSVAGAGSENPLDPELYRVHSREGQELEGGDAVHEGEGPAPTATVRSGVSGTQTGARASFDGSNHFDSRYSDGGNQFSGEPPDQGLCASDNARVRDREQRRAGLHAAAATRCCPARPASRAPSRSACR